MALYPNFIGPAYKLPSPNSAADTCLNMYPETIESGTGKNKMQLCSTPGITSFATLGDSPCRALWAGDNRLFAVGNDKLYEVSSGGTATLVGTMSTDGQPAKITSNGQQLMIITGDDVWIATGSSVVQPSYSSIAGLVNTSGVAVTWFSGDKFSAAMVGTTITINGTTYTVATFYDDEHIDLTASAGTLSLAAYSWSDTVAGVSGVFLDGYFVILLPDSNTIAISSIYNGLTWDPLDFAVRNTTDRCVALEVVNENLWIFGKETTQVWYNSGNADFPFEPIQGATIDQGLWARFTVQVIANTVCWLGASESGQCVVWQAVGYQPKRISTYAIESALQSYTTTTDAIGWSYQEDGHQFYVLNFPTAQKTWVYDLTEGLWHERAYYTSAGGGTLVNQLQSFHATTFDPPKHFVGGLTQSTIYTQSRMSYKDNGRLIRRIRTAPHLSDEQEWVFYSQFQLDLNTGQQASAPTIYLSWSNDGGNTFGSEIAVSSGSSTDYTKRVLWNRLGRSRDRVFRVRTDDDGPHYWVNAYLELEEGTGA